MKVFLPQHVRWRSEEQAGQVRCLQQAAQPQTAVRQHYARAL